MPGSRTRSMLAASRDQRVETRSPWSRRTADWSVECVVEPHRRRHCCGIGLRLAPVQLNFGNRNRLLVGLGSYLVNQVASCNDCHTNPSFAPGHDPFLGQPKQINANHYLAGGHAYPADDGETVFPPNITPDSTGKPAGLTYCQFVLAMRYGQDPAANRLLQVMPWPSYQDLTHRDLRAIYEYLSSIPSLPCNGNGC